jgi:hypothetical protein
MPGVDDIPMVSYVDRPATDTIYKVQPILKYKYPLQVGQQWEVQDVDPRMSMKVKKEIIGIDTIGVQAGEFECFLIRWYFDGDDDDVWDPGVAIYEWLSGAGIIKRTYDAQLIYTDTCAVSPCTLEVHYNYELQYYGIMNWQPPASQ